MTDLRDARLARALQEAPDSGALPSAEVRRAVQAFARESVARPQPESWGRKAWRRLWGESRQHMPWNTAFATIALGVLITVLWQGREVPDVRSDARPDARADAPADASADARADARADSPRTDVPIPSAPAPQPLTRATKAAPSTPAKVAAPPPAAAPPSLQGSVESANATPAPDALGKSAEPGAAAPAPAAAAPAPTAAREARSELARRMAPQMADQGPAAQQLRVESAGRSVTLSRAEAGRLARLMDQAVDITAGDEPLAAAPQVRIERIDAGGAPGVLELAGDQVRWTVRGSVRTGRPDPSLMQALRDEVQRALR